MYYNISNLYKEAIKKPDRRIKSFVVINNIRFDDDKINSIDYTGSLVSGGLTIGAVNANTVEIKFKEAIKVFLENHEVIPHIGILKSDNKAEFIPLGKFFITEINVDKNNNTTVVKAVDKMGFLNEKFESRISYPTQLRNVVVEIASILNVRLANTQISSVFVNKIEGATFRDALSYLSQIDGSFVTFNKLGELEFRKLNRTDKRIMKSNYFLKGLEVNDVDYRVNGISVDLKDKDKSILAVGDAIGNQIKLINPIMNQTMLNNVYRIYKSVRFKPFSLNWQGDPAIDLGDWVTIQVAANNEFITVPVLSMKFSYSGGLKSTISADIKASSSVSYEYKGTVQKQIEFLNARIGADGTNIFADTIEPENPKEGDTWFKPNGAFTDLFIFENGNWVKKVSTGNVDGLVTKITNDSVITPKLATAIAKIIELDANKITSGEIAFERLSSEVSRRIRDGLVTKEILSSFKADQNGIIQEINQKIDRSTDKTKQLLPAIINQEISRRKSELKGADGAKGDKGDKGERGQDGRTIYTHIAYSDSADGRTNFSTTDGLNKIYLGTYTDYTQADSNDPTRYKWQKVKGDDGVSINYNYIKNGNFEKNEASWEWVDNGSNSIYKDYNHSRANRRKSGIHIWSEGHDIDFYGVAQRFAFVGSRGDKVTVSFLAATDNRLADLKIGIHYRKNNSILSQEWLTVSKNDLVGNYKKFALVFTLGADVDELNLMLFGESRHSINNYITDVKLEKGTIATDWTPASEDMIPHSLTASVRSDRVYKNNVLSSGKSYVDVFYDGQKVSTGFTLNYLYKTGDVGWTRINGKSYSTDGSFDNAPTQQQNGQPFYIRCEISYKDLNTVADLRLDNILDGKDLIGNNLMYDSRFESIADSLKSNANPKTQFNIIDNVLRATASNNLDIRVRLKTFDTSTDKRNEYDNTYLRFNFRAKASTNVKLTGRLGFGGFVANQEQSVTTDWRQYTMLITDGGTGYDNWMALFTDKPCTLEIADCTVYNEGAMVVIKDVEQRQKVFESKLDSFTSVIGVTKQKISMSNADNLCTESNVTKTGNDLYFNLKSNKVANQKYTVIFEAENVPQNQKTAVYHSVQDKNIDNRPILKEGSNLYVVDFTGDLDNRINLYPCGANTKISNFRVYKGDFINDSFAKTEELTALQTKIAQTDREIGFAAERTERIAREVKPGENLCTEAGSKNINDQYWLIKENVVANQIYTLVCDIANPPKDQKASIYNSKTVDNKQLLVNGQNVFTFSYDPNKIPQNPKINLYPVGDKTVVSNVRIYKGDYNWYFKKDKIVTEQQLKSELKITADNITSTVEGKIDSKVSKTEFDQTKDHIELSYVKNDKVINAINLSKEGTKITGGAIVDNLYGKTIVGATLQGDTKIKIGQYGFMQPIDCGLQINAPATYGANYGVGLQIAGRSEGNVPKGLFIYNDPNFAYGNTIGNSINDILLTVKGKVSLCNNFDGEVVQGCPVISNFNYSNPVRGCYRISFLGWDANSNSLYFDDGTGSNGTWWVKPDSSSSDIKLKNNIIDCTHNALDFIKKLNFKEFDWIPDKFNYTKAHTKIGLIAQDVQKIDETLVNNLGGTLHLDDFRLLNINLKATQELNEENIKLRKELESTTRELINQRKEIIQLKQEIQNIKNLIKGDK